MMKKIELLSPAGGRESLFAAVQNGADAVYLGMEKFGARHGAENFDEAGLKEAVRYAKIRGVKVYLTLNTLVINLETEEFEKCCAFAAECGISAILTQDFGGAEIVRRVCPEMKIHASTQMSAHNERDVEALMKCGFSRIVVDRMMTNEEIMSIFEKTGAELEVFVHGALCVCVSGQCLMSSFIGGRSGNRGRCAQPCRQLYSCGNKKGYFLSPRDLCLLDEIKSLSEAGVASLKIEGRMKSAGYVAEVTRIYRDYIDNPRKASRRDIERLERVFVRGDGFTKGFYAGENAPEMMNYHISNDNIGGDKEVIREAERSYKDGAENRKVPIDVKFTAKAGERCRAVFSDGEHKIECESVEIAEVAQNKPLTLDGVKERIGKLGGTPYELRGFEAELDGEAIVPAREINAMRRCAAEKLDKVRGAADNVKINSFTYEKGTHVREKMYIAASCLTREQIKAAKGADVLYVPIELWSDQSQVVLSPKVIYDVDRYVKKLKEMGVKKATGSTVGVCAALIEAGVECVGDFGLNVFNYVSAEEYYKCGIKRLSISPECTAGEIRSIVKNTSAKCEIAAYGRMMLMVTRVCVIKGVRGRCDCEKPLELTDKTGARFWCRGDRNEHINEIYNAKKIFMADRREQLNATGADGIRLIFTDESGDEVKRIIGMYRGEIEAEAPRDFTRGYFAEGKRK
ncbi:MAG: U32 family peptidase [Clostridia bacterium]|nr:U32 family peptidase [Clostridia bacterium]